MQENKRDQTLKPSSTESLLFLTHRQIMHLVENDDIFHNNVKYRDALFVPPMSKNDAIFHLFTRKNPKQSQNLKSNDPNFEQSHFNTTLPTRIFIHGFQSNHDLTQRFADEYLKNGEFNFIAVNWTAGADTLDYHTACSDNIEIVAEEVANFIEFLINMGLDLNLLHMVGHSLGAHTMGLGQ